MQRQTGAGVPITAGTLTVNLASLPSIGATFSATEFGWLRLVYHDRDRSEHRNALVRRDHRGHTDHHGLRDELCVGLPERDASMPRARRAGHIQVGGTGTPVVNCGAVSVDVHLHRHRNGWRREHHVRRVVRERGGTPVAYSSTQASTIVETGQNTGDRAIAAGATSSNPTTLTASHNGSSTKTSTLTFGPYNSNVTVS